MFEYPLDPPIPVQSGDILAISQPPQGNSIFRVYYIQNIINLFGSIATKLLGSSPIDNDLVLDYPVTGGVINFNSYEVSFGLLSLI